MTPEHLDAMHRAIEALTGERPTLRFVGVTANLACDTSIARWAASSVDHTEIRASVDDAVTALLIWAAGGGDHLGEPG